MTDDEAEKLNDTTNEINTNFNCKTSYKLKL